MKGCCARTPRCPAENQPGRISSLSLTLVAMGGVNALAVMRFAILPIIVALATMFAFNGRALHLACTNELAARLGTARPDAAESPSWCWAARAYVVATVIAVVDYGLSYNGINPIYQAGVMGIVLIMLVLVENLVRSRGDLPRGWWPRSKAALGG